MMRVIVRVLQLERDVKRRLRPVFMTSRRRGIPVEMKPLVGVIEKKTAIVAMGRDFPKFAPPLVAVHSRPVLV